MKNFSVKFTIKNIAGGFTLAEVLITLLIIGVVASIIIPSIIADTQEQEYKTAWKKAYAEMAAAFGKVKMDNGGRLVSACTSSNSLMNLLIPYLSFTKSCLSSSTNGTNPCIYDTSTNLKRYSGQDYSTSWSMSSFILNNGSILLLSWNDTNCDTAYNNSFVKICGTFMIDINGNKNPNTVGKDFYHGWITKDGILPVGALDQNNSSAILYNSSSCNKSNSSAYGWGCSAKFLYQ